jgi:hypothetical protein
MLGSLCSHGHRYEGSPYSLRRRSNRGCAQCFKEQALARPDRRLRKRRKGQRQAATPPSPVGPQPQERPRLPTHLAGACFLSPITCLDAFHRYRETRYTLRFLDTELCTMCVGQKSTVHEGGRRHAEG